MNVKYGLSTLLLLLLGWRLLGQASAAFDSSLVETGEDFQLRLMVPDAYGQPGEVDFSAWDSIFPSDNILRQSGWQRDGQGWRNEATLICFDSAELKLPPLSIRLRDGAEVKTNALTLSVIPTISPDEISDMADIEGIRREPFHWLDALPWVLTGGGLLILAALIYWLGTRPRRPKMRSRTVQIPAHELALRRLDALARQQLWQSGRVKDYYAELTHIARQYLENRYRVPALESVSDEIMAQLDTVDFPPAQRDKLAGLLQWADRVKFAKGEPPAELHEASWQWVRHLVQTTRAVPVAPDPSA